MDHHNIESARLMITVLPKAKKKWSAKKAFVQERPASFGYFSIKQLQQILTRVIHEPSKAVHYFIFDGRRFRVAPYDTKHPTPNSVEPEDPV